MFHHSKQHRIGSDLGHDLILNQGEGDCSTIIENRQFLFNYFSTIFWSFDKNSNHFRHRGRTLFFLFYRAFPIILQRLLESSCLEEGCFQNVILFGIPVEDVISHSDPENLDSIYCSCYESYLNTLLCAQTSCFSFSITESEPVFHIDSLLSPTIAWIRQGSDWYLGRIITGSREVRSRKWDYLRHVIDRLNLHRCAFFNEDLAIGPSPIRFYHYWKNVGASRLIPSECDYYVGIIEYHH